jgi:hypothetical protein
MTLDTHKSKIVEEIKGNGFLAQQNPAPTKIQILKNKL